MILALSEVFLLYTPITLYVVSTITSALNICHLLFLTFSMCHLVPQQFCELQGTEYNIFYTLAWLYDRWMTNLYLLLINFSSNDNSWKILLFIFLFKTHTTSHSLQCIIRKLLNYAVRYWATVKCKAVNTADSTMGPWKESMHIKQRNKREYTWSFFFWKLNKIFWRERDS